MKKILNEAYDNELDRIYEENKERIFIFCGLPFLIAVFLGTIAVKYFGESLHFISISTALTGFVTFIGVFYSIKDKEVSVFNKFIDQCTKKEGIIFSLLVIIMMLIVNFIINEITNFINGFKIIDFVLISMIADFVLVFLSIFFESVIFLFLARIAIPLLIKYGREKI